MMKKPSSSPGTSARELSRVATWKGLRLRERRPAGPICWSGVPGEFSFAVGVGAVAVTAKPFWRPENRLQQKLTEGLDMVCNELG